MRWTKAFISVAKCQLGSHSRLTLARPEGVMGSSLRFFPIGFPCPREARVCQVKEVQAICRNRIGTADTVLETILETAKDLAKTVQFNLGAEKNYPF